MKASKHRVWNSNIADRLIIPDRTMRQGSRKWKSWRKGKVCTATQSPYVLRLYPPWADAAQSWEEYKKPRPPFAGNDATKHGTLCEPIARSAFNRELDETFEPACVEGDLNGHPVGVSLDGWSIKNGVESWVEIKSPYRGYESRLWRFAKDDIVDPGYVPQLAMQAMLMPPEAECFFQVYVSDWFDPYTGVQTRHADQIILSVSREMLEPYIEQLTQLIPKFAAGEPEPTADEIPLLS